SEVAEQYFVMGYSEMLLGELFCNGTPLSHTDDAGNVAYGPPLTNIQVYDTALVHLDSALTLAKSSVALGRFADAAAAVAGVPTNYTYNVTFSQATNDNNIWGLAGQVSTRARFVVGDSFDTQGLLKNSLPFSSAKDPRVPTTGSPTSNGTKSIDGITPLVAQQIWVNRFDPIPVATGVDARLVEAEAKLNTSDIAGMMTILNALRTSPQTLGPLAVPAMAPLAAPTTQTAATDLFFREKAFWQFGRGNRLGDLRRLIRQYGRTQDTVFPIGKFHKPGGASYGTDVNLPVTDNERQNPNFTGCIDRNA